jgi:N-ethylmaleimide reductase
LAGSAHGSFAPPTSTANIAAGGWQNKGYGLARANAALLDGTVDLVSFATLFLANPDLPERFRRSAALNAADRDTFYEGGAQGYVDYPTL